MLLRLMEKTGALVRSRSMLYKSVIQTVLLYGRDNSVITGAFIKVLEEFQHRIVRRLTGRRTRVLGRKVGDAPPSEEIIEATGLCPT